MAHCQFGGNVCDGLPDKKIPYSIASDGFTRRFAFGGARAVEQRRSEVDCAILAAVAGQPIAVGLAVHLAD